MDERKELGIIEHPIGNRIEFAFDITKTSNLGVYLEQLRPLPRIPDTILTKCAESKEELCLVRDLNGDMPWKIFFNEQVLLEGNYLSIDSSHQTILTLTRFTARPGKYKLVFEESNGQHEDAPKSRDTIYLE